MIVEFNYNDEQHELELPRFQAKQTRALGQAIRGEGYDPAALVKTVDGVRYGSVDNPGLQARAAMVAITAFTDAMTDEEDTEKN